MATAEVRQRATRAATYGLEIPSGSPSVHLDALRGLAAFSVLLTHWRDALFLDYSKIANHDILTALAYFATGLGHQWVIVFFVMSGYLVGGSVLRAMGSGVWTWRGYLLSRLTRLYIVLLPALLLGGVADWAGMHLAGADSVYTAHSGWHSFYKDVHLTLNLRTMAANSLFLQGIALPGMSGKHVPSFGSNGPLWSLCNEFWYYISFPFIVLALERIRKPWLTRAGYFAALLALGWFVGPTIALLGATWLMGSLIPYLPPLPARGPWMRVIAVVTALALLTFGLAFAKSLPGLGSDLALGVIVMLLIWVMIHCATAPVPAGYTWIAQRSARSSYTLYLVHVPALLFLKAWFQLPRAVPSVPALLVGAGVLVATVLYAQLVYEVFEKNTARVRNWIKPYVIGSLEKAQRAA
jgi:peptidoglycan/LPS O-acetylase OafA/YrhL